MKKIILLLLVIGFHQSVFAKVLKVKEYGVDGSYSSISLAVSASRPQDTIILYPKKFGLPFLESNLTVPHQIYFFNSDSSRFKFNFPVELNNCNVTNAIFSSYSVIKNATLVNCDFLEEIEIFNLELISCTAHKKVLNSINKSKIGFFGCQIKDFDFKNGFNKIRLIGNIFQNDLSSIQFSCDTIEIIGNLFKISGASYGSLMTVTPLIYGVVSNNVIQINNSNPSNYLLAFSRQNASTFFQVSNNQFLIYNGSNYYQFSRGIQDFFSGFESGFIVNNLFYYSQSSWFGSTNFGNSFMSNSSIQKGNLLISQQSIENNIWDTTNWYLNENKFVANYYSLNLDSNGIFVDSNLTVNKGVVIPQYLDIDLSVPDIGPYGGPMPITNFLNLDAQKAKVLYLQLPQKVFSPSGSIPIRATGATK
jgi:hypothetical protein